MPRKQLTFRASASVMHDLEMLAGQRQVTLSRLLRDAVTHYVRSPLITADNRVVHFADRTSGVPTVPTGLSRAMARQARDTTAAWGAYHDGINVDPQAVTTGQEGEE